MSTSSWVDEFARWTLRHAAHRAPPPLSERLEEEWLADMEARPDPWSRLLLGIGCCWAAAVIVQEDIAPCLTAATTTGNKVMSSYASTNGSLVPQRTTALAIIIGLHVVLIFAFATGLGPKVMQVLPAAITGTVLDQTRQDLPPPPPPSGPKSYIPTPTCPTWKRPPKMSFTQRLLSSGLPPDHPYRLPQHPSTACRAAQAKDFPTVPITTLPAPYAWRKLVP
jgi:hypothetical protein